MQPGYSQPPELDSAKIAFKQGIVFGPILAVISICFSLISTLSALSSLDSASTSTSSYYYVFFSILLNFLLFLIGVGAYLFVGARASNQTARVSTGTLAGLWTALIYGFIEIVGRLIIFFTISYPATVQAYQDQPASAQMSLSIAVFASMIGIVFNYLFAIGVGAGFGALGGLIGRRRARKRLPQSPLYNEQMYQGPGASSASAYTPYGQPPMVGGYHPYGQSPVVPSYQPPQSPTGYDSPDYYRRSAFSPQKEEVVPPPPASSEWDTYEHSSYEPQYMEAASVPVREESSQPPEPSGEETQRVSSSPNGAQAELSQPPEMPEEETQRVSSSLNGVQAEPSQVPAPFAEEAQLASLPSHDSQEQKSLEQEHRQKEKAE